MMHGQTAVDGASAAWFRNSAAPLTMTATAHGEIGNLICVGAAVGGGTTAFISSRRRTD